MSREGSGFQRMAMMLIMLPMWMNFLLRTYSWMSILENTGLLNRFSRSWAHRPVSTASLAAAWSISP